MSFTRFQTSKTVLAFSTRFELDFGGCMSAYTGGSMGTLITAPSAHMFMACYDDVRREAAFACVNTTAPLRAPLAGLLDYLHSTHAYSLARGFVGLGDQAHG